jgi:hypothetical protein
MCPDLLQVKLTQSNAVLRHIARKNNLAGSSLQEQAIADMCADQVSVPYLVIRIRLLTRFPFIRIRVRIRYKSMIRIRMLTRCPLIRILASSSPQEQAVADMCADQVGSSAPSSGSDC